MAVALVLASLLLQHAAAASAAAAEAAAASPPSSAASSCSTTSRSATSEHALLQRGSSSARLAAQAESEAQTFVGTVAGAQLVVHSGSKAAEGAADRWMVELPQGCSEEDLRCLAEHLPREVNEEYEGHPSKGGLCVAVLFGTQAQLEGVVRAVKEQCGVQVSVLESDAEVRVEPDLPEGEMPAGANSAEALSSGPYVWGLDRVDARAGRDSKFLPGGQGEGVHVYIFDTGIRTSHKDFGGRAVPTLDLTGGRVRECADAGADVGCALDRRGHGTHCAATVGGSSFGVAKKATLHSVKVLSDSGFGRWSWFLEAMDMVMTRADESPKVISASLAGRWVSPIMSDAVDSATGAGITVVVAAGNQAEDACNFAPAFVRSAITVGAMDWNDRRSSFSNYGACVDLFAPGSWVLSAGHASDTDRRFKSGTSMACPHVAGAAAILLANDPERSPQDVSQLLSEYATPDVLRDVGEGSPNKLLFVKEVTPPRKGLEGTCVLWGEPHIRGFDSSSAEVAEVVDVFSSGDFWIVKSKLVSIQGRYKPTQWSSGQASTSELAIGGPFLNNHKLIVTSRAGKVTWDGQPILSELPSDFTVPGLLSAHYHEEEKGRSLEYGQRHFKVKSVDLELPLGVRLTINRWQQHIDVMIVMRQQAGGQDGHCGNFNGDVKDDTTEHIKERFGRQVGPEETLFPDRLDTSQIASITATMDDCPRDLRSKAEDLCAKTEDSESRGALFKSCVFDVCFGGEEYAEADAAMDREFAAQAEAPGKA